MNTRFLIIIGVILTIIFLSALILNYYVDEKIKTQKFDDEQIDRIFKRCDYQKMMDARNWIGFDGKKGTDHQPLYIWENSTHYIDNNLCKFITLEEHEEGFTELRITGNLAEEICSITGGDCPPFYPAITQEDGSVMIVITVWDANTNIEKSFVFTVKNNILSYDVKENEN